MNHLQKMSISQRRNLRRPSAIVAQRRKRLRPLIKFTLNHAAQIRARRYRAALPFRHAAAVARQRRYNYSKVHPWAGGFYINSS